MQKVFILTINGTIYVFNRDEINDSVINKIKMYAKELTEKKLIFKNENDACLYFINQIEEKLKITLKRASITDIIRINIYIN